MTTQLDKALAFRALHEAPQLFIVPNPWSVGTARLLAHRGFPALATTSAGFAFACGLPDHAVGREQMLAHLAEITAAVDLPVSADLQNGYGDAPETVAETIRLAAEVGVVGGSIDDGTGNPAAPLYPLSQAVERIHAAVEAARALPFPFTLTARAENLLFNGQDVDDAIVRLQAYQAAGADVLFAPGILHRADIARLIAAVGRPINVMMGMSGMALAVNDLVELGVKRVSLGASLARMAMEAILRAVGEIQEVGTFSYVDQAVSNKSANMLFNAMAHDDALPSNFML